MDGVTGSAGLRRCVCSKSRRRPSAGGPKFGGIHPCVTFPLSDLEIIVPYAKQENQYNMRH